MVNMNILSHTHTHMVLYRAILTATLEGNVECRSYKLWESEKEKDRRE